MIRMCESLKSQMKSRQAMTFSIVIPKVRESIASYYFDFAQKYAEMNRLQMCEYFLG